MSKLFASGGQTFTLAVYQTLSMCISFNPQSNLIFIPCFIAEKFEAQCYPKSHNERGQS